MFAAIPAAMPQFSNPQKDTNMHKLPAVPPRWPAFVATFGLAQAQAPAAAAPAPDHTFTGKVALFSEYEFRGISQTSEKPALQLNLDYAHASGFYARPVRHQHQVAARTRPRAWAASRTARKSSGTSTPATRSRSPRT